MATRLKSKGRLHYFLLTLLILMAHIGMLGVVFFKGNYDSYNAPIILSMYIVLFDIVYSIIISRRKQSVYTIDYIFMFILNMSVIFQSCFGKVGFSYKQAILSVLAIVCCEIGCKITKNPI